MATPIIKIVPMPGIQVPGPTGAAGANGTNGVGVPTGGASGQVLAKASNNNYDTEWISGVTGSFVSQDGKTITVTNGIITGIEVI